MFGNQVAATSYYFASTYGQSAFGTDTYNGQATSNQTTPATPPTQTTTSTTPGAPNTGFFNSVVSGSNEYLLLPIILGLAVGVGALTIGIKKFTRARKS